MQKAVIFLLLALFFFTCQTKEQAKAPVREKISINEGWHFYKYASLEEADSLIYDVRPEITDTNDDKPADSQPTEAQKITLNQTVLKPWILPTGNAFIKYPEKRHVRPEGQPGQNFPFVKADFADSLWQTVDLPHDWAIEGPFMAGESAEVGGGMGRLPSHGVAWYRKKLDISESDAHKRTYLEVDGAMSYAMVWLNGHLVGGWPYGYNSWRVDLTPYLNFGGDNQLAIRLDNPNHSSRWYPGGGIYRNVWLIKTNPIHVDQWGTFVTTSEVSEKTATVDVEVTIANQSATNSSVEVMTEIFALNENGEIDGASVGESNQIRTATTVGEPTKVKQSITLLNPRLWGPPPTQQPNRYVAVTTLRHKHQIIDQYNTPFGIRTLQFDGQKGLMVNGEPIFIKGVNQHHDLGALGAAFNKRAAERQLEILLEMGCNAIRIAHNPPAPELLELTDRMGILVVNEIFDVWERKKTPQDFHLIFPDWYEQDLRAFVRRDRNNPSVIMWSYGNEVGEQYTDLEGAQLSQKLHDIVKEEDPTRPTTASMNYAKPDMPFSEVPDVINLNYQGEGIRDTPAHAHLQGIRTSPLYPAFHEKYPDKLILSSENAAALSTRGTYMFPVHEGISSPVTDQTGGDSQNRFVSAYELYAVDFGSSADKVFATKDQHPYVGGGFVWSGWDYLGEPTPYYLSRSTYFGIIDLAVNGESLGRKQKGDLEYRLRWPDVKYQPGELRAVAYKNGEVWAESSVRTTGPAEQLVAEADRDTLSANGRDLAFITLRITDKNGDTVPDANHPIKFTLDGPGYIVGTDNGDPTDMTPFPSMNRKAFNGLCLVIVSSKKEATGAIQIKAESDGLQDVMVTINAN
ncbi:MAG: DUF4982 domain-containing protein [Bacteroidales bacterium]|nr:DUF4982 domain-containing protein [Bacteroidales bacterium]